MENIDTLQAIQDTVTIAQQLYSASVAFDTVTVYDTVQVSKNIYIPVDGSSVTSIIGNLIALISIVVTGYFSYKLYLVSNNSNNIAKESVEVLKQTLNNRSIEIQYREIDNINNLSMVQLIFIIRQTKSEEYNITEAKLIDESKNELDILPYLITDTLKQVKINMKFMEISERLNLDYDFRNDKKINFNEELTLSVVINSKDTLEAFFKFKINP